MGKTCKCNGFFCLKRRGYVCSMDNDAMLYALKIWKWRAFFE
jgi:hypothetical protein